MDCVLEYMRANGIEISRDNYLNLAYMGDVPELDAESESMLPPEFQNEEFTAINPVSRESTGTFAMGSLDDGFYHGPSAPGSRRVKASRHLHLNYLLMSN
jgi:hypothetical protein